MSAPTDKRIAPPTPSPMASALSNMSFGGASDETLTVDQYANGIMIIGRDRDEAEIMVKSDTDAKDATVYTNLDGDRSTGAGDNGYDARITINGVTGETTIESITKNAEGETIFGDAQKVDVAADKARNAYSDVVALQGTDDRYMPQEAVTAISTGQFQNLGLQDIVASLKQSGASGTKQAGMDDVGMQTGGDMQKATQVGIQ